MVTEAGIRDGTGFFETLYHRVDVTCPCPEELVRGTALGYRVAKGNPGQSSGAPPERSVARDPGGTYVRSAGSPSLDPTSGGGGGAYDFVATLIGLFETVGGFIATRLVDGAGRFRCVLASSRGDDRDALGLRYGDLFGRPT